MEKEIIDVSENSPRFKQLKEVIDKWVDENAESEKHGIHLVLLGYDEEYKHAIKFSLGSKKDPIESIIQSFNHSLGNLKESLEIDLFNGMCEYLGRVFATYPQLYEIFKENVEEITRNYEENKKNK